MSKEMRLISELAKLCQMSASSPQVYLRAIDITMEAFNKEKPLFKEEEKPQAAKFMEKSMPFFDQAFSTFRAGMNLDNRQSAQMSRSGLQFLVDEFKGNQEVYQKVKNIFNFSSVKSIEEYIKNTAETEPEYSTPYEIDMSKIPENHFWWFFVESE